MDAGYDPRICLHILPGPRSSTLINSAPCGSGEDSTMNFFVCWHRPGKIVRGIRTCRNCGIAIEECGHESRKRKDGPCPVCDSSAWVAIVRSRRAAIAQTLDLEATR